MAQCFYYFFMIVVVIRYKPKATARRALTFIVRIFVNDTIAIAVWTCFHVLPRRRAKLDEAAAPSSGHAAKIRTPCIVQLAKTFGSAAESLISSPSMLYSRTFERFQKGDNFVHTLRVSFHQFCKSATLHGE